MSKRIKNKIIAVAGCAAISIAMTGCGAIDWIKPESTATTTKNTKFTATTAANAKAGTTKTATYKYDGDDGNYTTPTTITGSLQNTETSKTDRYDPDVRATMGAKTTTLYTLPAGVTTTTTTKKKFTTSVSTDKNGEVTTAFTADKLFPLTDGGYSGDITYIVASDTDHLNLRFGPSKKYEVEAEIPNNTSVVGKGEITGSDGNIWVFTSYNGTAGWVMKDLLQKQ